jgi:argininosuccinate lyase
MSFLWKKRFNEDASNLLKHYYADILRRPEMLEAVHAFDKAQLIMIAESGRVPKAAVKKLVKAIATMEKNGVVEERTKLWNVVHGGEEYLREKCGEDAAGWIHLGRSSPAIRVVATRVAFREKLLQIMYANVVLRKTMIRLAGKHIKTLMPGYQYIQHGEASTFGYYLMSFVEPLHRDFGRLQGAYENANISSVCTGGGYGTEYDLDVARLDELLGFTSEMWNARDSIRNYDYAVEAYMALALMHNTLGRLALDFLIWHSQEFNFIRLPDRHSISSSVAPQMRIPYVLEFINGTSGLITGRLMEMMGILKTASDQLEAATMLPAEFWTCCDESQAATQVLTECLDEIVVNKKRMAEGAEAHWVQSTTLIAYLVNEKGMSFRVAHQILGGIAQEVVDKGLPPSAITVDMIEDAAKAHTGKKIGLTEEALKTTMDAWTGVTGRKYRGGTAPERVRDHINAAKNYCAADLKTLKAQARGIERAETKRNQAFEKLRAQK